MWRMMAKQVKPRLVITEKDGKWTLRAETILRAITTEFIPGVEYEETTPDGREVRVRLFGCIDEFSRFFFSGNHSI
jgi:hypothetical protein